MANETGGPSFSTGDYPTWIGKPPERVIHRIDDHELNTLIASRRDGLLEALWGCAGLIGASIVPAIAALRRAYKPEPNLPLGIEDALNVGLLLCSLTAGIVILVIWSRRGKSGTDLANAIKNRDREPG